MAAVSIRKALAMSSSPHVRVIMASSSSIDSTKESSEPEVIEPLVKRCVAVASSCEARQVRTGSPLRVRDILPY